MIMPALAGTMRLDGRTFALFDGVGIALWAGVAISSGMLVTAGGLVFYGTVDGWFKALDARTGRILWKHRVDGKRLDAPMSYRGSDGHQYIAVHALARGPGDGGDTLLLFALAH